MLEARRLGMVEPVFRVRAAGRLVAEGMGPWVQDLGVLVEAVEAGRPPGAPPDWQPGAVLRMPFSKKICREGGVACAQALMALADAAMMVACAAAWDGYRPMTPMDQPMLFLRRVTFAVGADARVVGIGPPTSFGRVMLYSAVDKRPVGMVASAYAIQ